MTGLGFDLDGFGGEDLPYGSAFAPFTLPKPCGGCNHTAPHDTNGCTHTTPLVDHSIPEAPSVTYVRCPCPVYTDPAKLRKVTP